MAAPRSGNSYPWPKIWYIQRHICTLYIFKERFISLAALQITSTTLITNKRHEPRTALATTHQDNLEGSSRSIPGNNGPMSPSPSARGRSGMKSMKGLSVSVPSSPCKVPEVLLFGPGKTQTTRVRALAWYTLWVVMLHTKCWCAGSRDNGTEIQRRAGTGQGHNTEPSAQPVLAVSDLSVESLSHSGPWP